MTDQMIDSIGRIDEDMINRVNELRRKKHGRSKWMIWGAVAACFCTAVLAGYGILTNTPGQRGQTLPGDMVWGKETAVTPDFHGDEGLVADSIPQSTDAPDQGGQTLPGDLVGGKETVVTPDLQGDEEIADDKLVVDSIPPSCDKKITLQEAQKDETFGRYMLKSLPGGFTEEGVHKYEKPNGYSLYGVWTKGYDEINWRISAYSEENAARITSIAATENYDLSLYSIPFADSVPGELWEIVNDPIFIAEELTLDVVKARAYKVSDSGDSKGYRMRFGVKYDDVIVNVYAKGIEPEWVYQQLAELMTD